MFCSISLQPNHHTWFTLKKIFIAAPTPGDGLFQFKLVAARDAASTSTTSVEECQNLGSLKPAIVAGSIVLCLFSQGFYNGTSTVNAILNTATSLGFLGFIFLANPTYGDFVAEPLPFRIPGIMVPSVVDAQVGFNLVCLLFINLQLIYVIRPLWYPDPIFIPFFYNLFCIFPISIDI